MANLVVEYVNCLSNEADKPLYSAKNPSFFTICTVIPAKLKLPLPEKKIQPFQDITFVKNKKIVQIRVF